MAKATKEKKPASPADKGANGHTFIEHENLPVERKAAVTEIRIVTVEEQITMEVAKFGSVEEDIAQLRKDYENMVIATKDDYDVVKKAWNKVRDFRTGIEKKKAEIKRDYLLISKAIDGAETRLVGLVKPLEDTLYKRWKEVDEAKHAEKDRLLKEEEDKLKARIQELVNAGMALTDGWYCLGESITVDVATVRAMPDDKYATFLLKVQTTATRLAEQAQLDANKKKLEQQQDDDRKKALKEQQDILDKQKKDLKEQQDQLDRDKAAAAKVRRDNRILSLKAMGYSYSTYDDEFRMLTAAEPLVIQGAQVFDLEDEVFTVSGATWNKQAADANRVLQQQRDDRDKAEKALAARKEEIAKRFQALGMIYSYEAGTLTFENRLGKVSQHLQQLLELSEVELAKAVEDTSLLIKKKINELTTLETTERDQAEKDRREKLGDKELLTEWFDFLRKVPIPVMVRTLDGRKIFNTVNARLMKLLADADLLIKQMTDQEADKP